MKRISFLCLALLIALLITSCREEAVPSGDPTQTAPIVVPPTPLGLEPAYPAGAPPTPETLPTPSPEPSFRTTQPYQVAYVPAETGLSVRDRPGDSSQIAILASNTISVTISGPGQFANGIFWAPVTSDETIGYVNSLFLVEMVNFLTFCQDGVPLGVIDAFRQAVANRDETLLTQIIHPERGLRIRHDWWNREVYLTGQEALQLFSNPAGYNWGTHSGSGAAVEGPISNVILPLFDRDLTPATQLACNTILHGSTTTTVQRPAEYEGVNFYSVFRPAPADSEFDWGSWVIGLERWQGRYYISYLIHYAWEI